MTRKNRRPPVVTFDERACSEPGCSARYTPTAPNSKYCDEHSDQRLRTRGQWAQLRERARRRAIAGNRCECCGAPASGPSYHGIQCCDKCYDDAQVAGREHLIGRTLAGVW